MTRSATIARANRRNTFRNVLRFETLEPRRVFACLPSPTSGPDHIACDGSNDSINGGPGRDRVYGGPGNDTVGGGQDDDYVVMGDEGDDSVYGGRGNDGDMTFANPSYFVNGGMGNDRVFGGDGNDVVRGGQGSDWVYGDDDPAGAQLSPVATGNDWIAGDLGNDQLFGQGGADTFYFGIDAAGIVDTIHDWTPSQGDRNDLTAFDAQPGNAFAPGVITDFGSLAVVQVGGNTEITLPTGQKIVLINTAFASVQPQHFVGKASIDRRGNDNLQANNLGEQLNGREGDDVVTGGIGLDLLNGNTGRDRVYGGPGNDTVGGGQDDDYVVMGDEGDDLVYGGRGNDGDITFANPAYSVNGGMGNDRVFGGDGNDVVRGGQGDDWVYGDDDPAGVQLSPVATGNDWIAGDLGNDQLFGQSGADTFYFGIDAAGMTDTINDWTPSQGDRIDLTAFDSQPGNAFAPGVITDFGSLAMVQVGGNTEITLPTGQRIVLINTMVASMQPQHFVGKASIDRRGNDILQANNLGEQLNGREGDDVVTGGSGPDLLNGNTGRDRVYGGAGNDTVGGGQDDDYVVMGDEGDDLVYGGRGNDGDMTFANPAYFVNGGMGDDRVFGGDGNDVVRGGQGDDRVYGDDDPSGVQLSPVAAGNDWIAGDLGNDQLWGQGGADTFYFGFDTSGIVDTINDWTPSQGDRIDLSAFDAQPGNAFATGVITDFGSLAMIQVGGNTEITLPTGQKIVLINTVVASVQPQHFVGKASIDRRGNDVLVANSLGEQLNGREGDDQIIGGPAADNINGNRGSDTIDGGLGNDVVRGGKDDDLVSGSDGDDTVYGDLGNDNVNGNKGRDIVYGGPGNDIVGGGMDDDYGVYGEDGDDKVYGGEGNDADINGNMGNDEVYGGNGNDVVRGGKGDDYVSGDAGDDMLYGGYGINVLVGGPGKDTFVLDRAFDAQNTIVDFERGQDRIDVTALSELTTFEQLVFVQQGSNTFVQFAPTNKLIIQGQTPSQIRSTDFIGPWSAKKAVYLWVPGLLHDRITQAHLAQGGANATTPTGEPVIKVAEYRINGFNPLANPGNITPHKPFQLIDLRSVSISNVTWRQDGSDTVVDLDSRFGKVLRLVGVNATQVTRANFLTVGQNEQTTINAYLADWTDQSQVDQAVVPPADRFYHEGSRVYYESTPTVISLLNKKVQQSTSNSLIVGIGSSGQNIQIAENFNPANPLHKLDLTGTGVSVIDELGFEQIGSDTKVNFPNGKSLVLRNVLRSELSEASFFGWSDPTAYEVFLPSTGVSRVEINDFDATSRHMLLDLSQFMDSRDFSEIRISADEQDTVLEFAHSASTVVLKGVAASLITPDKIIGKDSMIDGDVVIEAKGYDTLFGGAGSDTLISAKLSETSSHTKALVAPATRTPRLPSSSSDWEVAIGSNIHNFTTGAGEALKDLDFSGRDKVFGVGGALIDATQEFIDASLETDPNAFSIKALRAAGVVGGALSIVSISETYHREFNAAFSLLRSRGIPEDIATKYANRHGATIAIGKEVTGAISWRLGAVIGVNAGFLHPILAIPGGLLGAAAGALSADTVFETAFVDTGMVALSLNGNLEHAQAEYDSQMVGGGSGAEILGDTVFMDDLGAADAELIRGIPSGGTALSSNGELLEKAVDYSGAVYVKKFTATPRSPKYGTGIDPNTIDPPLGQDLDSENGSAYTYAEGVFYKWNGFNWTAIPRGSDLLSLADFASNLLYYADETGTFISDVATQTVVEVSSIVSDSVRDWYDALVNPQTGPNGTTPSGITQTASQAAGAFLAEIVLNGDFDSALKRGRDVAVRSAMNTVTNQIEKKVTAAFGDSMGGTAVSFVQDVLGVNKVFATHSVGLAVDLAKAIGEQLIRGEFDDSFASNIATQVGIQWGVGQGIGTALSTFDIGTNMTVALANGLELGTSITTFIGGFDPISVAASIIITTLLNEYFNEEIAEIATFLGDVGEEIWDFVRDPVNSIKNIFDDPKFHSVDGTNSSDTLYQPSGARIQSDLKAGNDVMFGGDGWGIVLGNLGDDIILHGNTIPGGGVPGNGVGELYGEEGADFISAGGGNDELHGGGGADVLLGGPGNDYLWGGDTQRTYSRNTGGDEGDYLDGGLGNDFYTGNAGRDTFFVTLEPGAIDTFLHFVPGEDWIDLSQFNSLNDFGDIQIVNENGKAVIRLPDNQKVVFEYVTAASLRRGDFIFTQYGTPGPDVLLGSDSVEIFNGLEGNDDLRLGGGNDIAHGNQGDDQISGGAGDDQLRGGLGNDTVNGGEGIDVIYGGLGNDSLNGNQGSDRVDGGGGNDEVHGGKDDDDVIGGEGDDKLFGGLGNDVLLGGPGADDFHLNPDPGSTDYIQDFTLSQGDELILAGFDSSPIVAEDVVQVGYDTYIFFPNSQRVIVRFADAAEVRNNLGLVSELDTPGDQAAPTIEGIPGSLVINGTTILRPAQNAQIGDADSPDLSGGKFVATIQSGVGSLLIQPQTGSAVNAQENRVSWNGFDIGSFQSTADGKSLTVEFGVNAVPSAIDAVIHEIAAANFQGGTISFLVTDGDGGTSDLATTLLMINDAPTDILLTNSSVVENAPVDTAVGALSVVDPNSTDTFTYAFVSGEGSQNNVNFRIDANGVVRTLARLDFESQSVHSIRIRATDQVGLFFEKVMSITIVNVTELTQPVQIGEGSAQRSIIRQLVLNFDNAISAEPGAFIVQQRRTDAGVVSFHDVTTQAVLTSTSSGGTRVTLTFSGSLTNGFGALADGNYQLTVFGAKVKSVDSQLAFDGDGDGVAGGNLVYGAQLADQFFALFGDANGDGVVGVAEFGQFRSAFGKTSSQAGYDALFDYEGDGFIGVSDFGQFRSRFGKSRMPF